MDINDYERYIYKVDEDFGRHGNTKLRCPRCGGKFIYEDYGSGRILRCEKENCIKVTFRGI